MIELECIPIEAGHRDEGVCLWLRIGPYRVLCDCGLSTLTQLHHVLAGESGAPELHQDALPIDFVWCSHAHEGHARGLWALHRAYPTLPIYTSEVTAHLLPLNWLETPDPEQKNFCVPIPMHSRVEVSPGLTLTLYPAGHLPGAAIALFSYQHPTENRDYTLLYTGDFLLSNARLVDGVPLSELRDLRPDVLILEGSFGTARHSHRRQQENQLTQRIFQALQQKRSVMLVVPQLGLAQELLVLLRSHHTFTGKNIDIWVEETIAIGCDLYLEILHELPEAVQNFARHQSLFWDERIRPRVRRFQATALTKWDEQPCIVLLSPQTNLDAFCAAVPRPWLILFPQFPKQPATLKRKLFAQKKSVTLETYLLAEHSDGVGTTQLIHNVRPQHVVFVHGQPSNLDNLTSLEELASRYHLHSPQAGAYLEFPLGLIQQTLDIKMETTYEGEIQAEDPQILMAFPAQIREDPRWRFLADTGVIVAHWQGENLMIRGMQQYDLFLKNQQGAAYNNLQGCLNCVSYRSQKCTNPKSPLYELRVAPDGYCPSYVPKNEI